MIIKRIIEAIDEAIASENAFLIKNNKSLLDLHEKALVHEFLKKLNNETSNASIEWFKDFAPNEKKELPPNVVDVVIKNGEETIALEFGNRYNYHDYSYGIRKLKNLDKNIRRIYAAYIERPQDDTEYENYKSLLINHIGLEPSNLIHEVKEIKTSSLDHANKEYKAALHVWEIK